MQVKRRWKQGRRERRRKGREGRRVPDEGRYSAMRAGRARWKAHEKRTERPICSCAQTASSTKSAAAERLTIWICEAPNARFNHV